MISIFAANKKYNNKKMKNNITTICLLVLILATTQFSNAQYTVKQVIVLNQGTYSQTVPVTVGSYNLALHQYQKFDSIPEARFSSYVIIDSGFIYVAADSFLIKYDLNT